MTAKSIDQYIAQYPKEIQELLTQMQMTIRKAAPEAEECINYGMPTFKLKGNLVHFAAAKKHIGFYPAPSAITEFESSLKDYKHAKGSVQFPFTKPLPLDLVRKMVEFRVKENLGE